MFDFLLYNNNLIIENGDFKVGVSDEQHQVLLLECAKGSFKANPNACVNLFSFLENESPADLLREINLQFTGDGMQVKKVEFEGGKLLIDASY
jgi:hypothetical protein